MECSREGIAAKDVSLFCVMSQIVSDLPHRECYEAAQILLTL
jgi:hypothetical protein